MTSREVNIDSNRTQTTRVRVGVGATRRSSKERRRQDTDPGLADIRKPSPEDVATTAIIIRAGATEAGARASGRCHRLIFRPISMPIFCLIIRLEKTPTHRGTHLRQIVPTRTNTWDTRGGGSQRGTVHAYSMYMWLALGLGTRGGRRWLLLRRNLSALSFDVMRSHTHTSVSIE